MGHGNLGLYSTKMFKRLKFFESLLLKERQNPEFSYAVSGVGVTPFLKSLVKAIFASGDQRRIIEMNTNALFCKYGRSWVVRNELDHIDLNQVSQKPPIHKSETNPSKNSKPSC